MRIDLDNIPQPKRGLRAWVDANRKPIVVSVVASLIGWRSCVQLQKSDSLYRFVPGAPSSAAKLAPPPPAQMSANPFVRAWQSVSGGFSGGRESLPALSAPEQPRLSPTDMVASGDFGVGDYIPKVGQPQTVQGVMNKTEATRATNAINFKAPSPEDAPAVRAAAGAARAAKAMAAAKGLPGAPPAAGTPPPAGSAPAGDAPPIDNAPVVGDALTGPGGAPDGGPPPTDAPVPQAGGQSLQGSRSYKPPVSNGHLRAFLRNDARLTSLDGAAFFGEGGNEKAAYQLAQTKVVAKAYSGAPSREEAAQYGITYDGHHSDTKVIHGAADSATPDIGGGGQAPNVQQGQSEMKANKDCEAYRSQMINRRQVVEDLFENDLYPLTQHLTDVGINMAIDCGGKCPNQCGQCKTDIAEKQVTCQRIRNVVGLINQPQSIPPGCQQLEEWQNAFSARASYFGVGTKQVAHNPKIGDCSVQLNKGGVPFTDPGYVNSEAGQCGHDNPLWGQIYCVGMSMSTRIIPQLTAADFPDCEQSDQASCN